MSYFLMLGMAFSIGILWGGRNAAKRQQGFLAVKRYVLGTIIGSLLGARVFHILFEGHLYDYLADPTQALLIWNGGLSVWGGLIGTLLTTLLLFRKDLPKLARLHDCFAPTFAFGLALTRIGCYFSGCCYGKVTDVPWSITYGPHHLAYYWQKQEGLILPDASSTLPIHPTQLYEMLGALLLAFGTQVAFNKAHLKSGGVALITLIGYSMLRFFIEFFRADERGSSIFGLSTPQIIALIVGSSSTLLILTSYREKNTSWLS